VEKQYTLIPKKFVLLIICALFIFYPALAVSAQSGTVVRAEASASQPHVGDTLTVQIIISNVQNLYGVDVELSWNAAVLQEISAQSLLGVESHSGGVLHESSSAPIYFVEDNASQALGEYNLVATSQAPAPAFSGSGTMATLKFSVIGTGSAGLALSSSSSSETELSDYNPAGSNLIAHTDTTDSVTAVGSGSSTTPRASTTPTSSSTASPSSTPEFPSLTIIALFIVIATSAIILRAKQLKKNKIGFTKSSQTNY
jgi:hypothetical protein